MLFFAVCTKHRNNHVSNTVFEAGNLRGCPSLVGGRPAKPVVLTGRAGSNPAPRAILDSMLGIVG
jgi:hypothetical protein